MINFLFDGDQFTLEVAEINDLVGLIRCHYGYHVWPGEPWDHCMRGFCRYPEQASDLIGVDLVAELCEAITEQLSRCLDEWITS